MKHGDVSRLLAISFLWDIRPDMTAAQFVDKCRTVADRIIDLENKDDN